LLNAAHSLMCRFNPSLGVIRSWNREEWNKQWQFPVMIDNMMNLELFMVVAREFKDSALLNTAICHAKKKSRTTFATITAATPSSITTQ